MRTLARSSGVQIDIDTGRFPDGPALAAAATALGRAGVLDWVLTGGEDHALAATFPAGRALPQLPLLIGRNGELRAAGTFSGPVGPSWWGVRMGKART